MSSTSSSSRASAARSTVPSAGSSSWRATASSASIGASTRVTPADHAAQRVPRSAPRRRPRARASSARTRSPASGVRSSCATSLAKRCSWRREAAMRASSTSSVAARPVSSSRGRPEVEAPIEVVRAPVLARSPSSRATGRSAPFSARGSPGRRRAGRAPRRRASRAARSCCSRSSDSVDSATTTAPTGARGRGADTGSARSRVSSGPSISADPRRAAERDRRAVERGRRAGRALDHAAPSNTHDRRSSVASLAVVAHGRPRRRDGQRRELGVGVGAQHRGPLPPTRWASSTLPATTQRAEAHRERRQRREQQTRAEAHRST